MVDILKADCINQQYNTALLSGFPFSQYIIEFIQIFCSGYGICVGDHTMIDNGKSKIGRLSGIIPDDRRPAGTCNKFSAFISGPILKWLLLGNSRQQISEPRMVIVQIFRMNSLFPDFIRLADVLSRKVKILYCIYRPSGIMMKDIIND